MSSLMGDDDSVGIHQGVTRWSKHWAILHWSAPGFQLSCCVAKPPKPARVSSVIAFAAEIKAAKSSLPTAKKGRLRFDDSSVAPERSTVRPFLVEAGGRSRRSTAQDLADTRQMMPAM